MRKDLTTVAMIGLLAGFCLSANAFAGGKEIAMSKCSKENTSSNSGSRQPDSSDEDQSDYNDSSDYDNSDCDSCGNCSDQSDTSLNMQTKRKAIADQIVQGDK